MLENPLFSVLIANYNNARYLLEAIESVYNQTYTNWEIIIVDDGSTDNSHELYRELEKENKSIKIYYNRINKGCGYTKRRCAELADGEICGFLDPDDVLLPDAIQQMVDVHIANPEVSIVYSRCYLCDNKLNITGENLLLQLKENETYFDYRHKYGILNFATYKNSYYTKTEGVSTEIKAGVDQDLYFKMEEIGKIYVLNEFTYKYRLGVTGAITNNFSKLWYWNILIRHNTCIRRGLNPEDYALPDFVEVLEIYGGEKALKMQSKIYSSKAYRIGKLLLKPFKYISRNV